MLPFFKPARCCGGGTKKLSSCISPRSSLLRNIAGGNGQIIPIKRVFPGQHLPGHMGVDRVTVKNLAVVGVDAERSLLLVKGAVPGSPRGVVLITAKR